MVSRNGRIGFRLKVSLGRTFSCAEPDSVIDVARVHFARHVSLVAPAAVAHCTFGEFPVQVVAERHLDPIIRVQRGNRAIDEHAQPCTQRRMRACGMRDLPELRQHRVQREQAGSMDSKPIRDFRVELAAWSGQK